MCQSEQTPHVYRVLVYGWARLITLPLTFRTHGGKRPRLTCTIYLEEEVVVVVVVVVVVLVFTANNHYCILHL